MIKVLANISLVVLEVVDVLEFKVVKIVLVANNLDYIDILLIESKLSNSLLIVVVIELKKRIADLIAERSIL